MTRGIANLQCWPKYHYYVTRLRINNEITEDASQSLLNQAEILKLVSRQDNIKDRLGNVRGMSS